MPKSIEISATNTLYPFTMCENFNRFEARLEILTLSFLDHNSKSKQNEKKKLEIKYRLGPISYLRSNSTT